MTQVVPAQLDHLESRADHDARIVGRLNDDVADDVTGAPLWSLRPGVWMLDPAHADFHHPSVFGKDGWRVQPLGLLRRDWHPVNPVRTEQIEVSRPLPLVEQLRLIVKELLDALLEGCRCVGGSNG